jgi:DNA-binding NarL/FixJ family response regulator
MPSRKTSGKGAGDLAIVGIIIHARQYRSAIEASLLGREGIIPVDLGDGADGSIDRLRHIKPQVLLVDLPRARLTELLRVVHSESPTLPLLAVNCDERVTELLALFEAGLTGFVPHDAGPEDLVRAIHDALAGEFHCPPRIAAALVRRVNSSGGSAEASRAPSTLTAREAQVARLLERSLTNKEIASRLGLEVATVRNHVYSICRKLDAHRRGEVVARLSVPALHVVRGRRGRRREG